MYKRNINPQFDYLWKKIFESISLMEDKNQEKNLEIIKMENLKSNKIMLQPKYELVNLELMKDLVPALPDNKL